MMNILSALTKFLGSRLVINLFGLIAIVSLVLLIGAMLHVSVKLQLLIIIIILLVFILLMLSYWLWARYRGNILQKQLQAQNESIAARELELGLLKEKMVTAIAQLKASELGVRYRGNAALYALPWYMIIGPSACGKSTLLRNSGLNFPFSSHEDLQVKGFGGTRNCDWWFAAEAIILDTAGRYTTEESDHEEWLAFLDLLKRYRPRLPINGIIVAISIADLLTAGSDNITWHVKVVRSRIDQLYQRFGYIFPVTLLFTKCDLLKGFAEFFADLNTRDREQLWGLNFTNNINDKLIQLYNKLTQLRLHKMAMERNLVRKFAIYDFPEQFRAGLDGVIEFINQLIKNNPYQESPLFTGIYFTSGTQEGAPIQRLLGNLNQVFGYVTDAETQADVITKSYFIKELFTKIIFPLKNSAAKTKERVKLMEWLKSFTVLVCFGVVVSAFVLFGSSLTNNSLLLHRGEKAASLLLTDDSFASLNRVYDYYRMLTNYQQIIPWRLRLGLYRGNEEIEPLTAILTNMLHTKFMLPMGAYLTAKLQRYYLAWSQATPEARELLRGRYYTALKAYLMLAFPNRIVKDQAEAIFSYYWGQIISGKAVDITPYQGLVTFFLAHPSAWPADKQLVSAVRAQLYLADATQNLYAQITNIIGVKYKAITVKKLLGGNYSQLFIANSSVPGIYTVNAWNHDIRYAIGQVAHEARYGDWVITTPFEQLDTPQSALNTSLVSEANLAREIKNLYFNNYKNSWLQFLGAIRVRQFSSLTDANAQIANIAAINGPIWSIINGAATNFALKELSGVAHEFNCVLGDVLNSYLNTLIKIQDDLQKIVVSPNSGRDAENYAGRLLSGNGGNTQLYQSMIAVNLLVNRLNDGAVRDALKELLLQPIRESWRTILQSAMRGLQGRWESELISDYQQNISGKFPFDRYADQEVALNDIVDFFHPKTGVLWSFVNTDLGPFLSFNLEGWQTQKWLGLGAEFSSQTLTSLTRAKLLSDALFNNTDQPGFVFQLYPLPTQGISEIAFAVNGQVYTYRNGPEEWHNFAWPGKNDGQNSYLSVVTIYGINPEPIEWSGIWGIFHLINSGVVLPNSGSQYRVMWHMHEGDHHYNIKAILRTSSRINIFYELLTNKYNLPLHLFNNISSE